MNDNHTILIENLKNRMSKDQLLGYALIGVKCEIKEKVRMMATDSSESAGTVGTPINMEKEKDNE